ncbi:hypothetical protein [Hymenobacter rubidus]|uniref:hypothetical protein n=1 Tax=Hymenobacter rubidus TaxID=1441626 RepID=UPI00191DC1E2|nr:hypothetical protein [Hymenobacter rubidus]
MEYAFGLFFTLLKVAVQASIYATLVLVLTRIWAGFSPDSRLIEYLSNGKRLWWRSGFAASIALLLLANTPWGDHGLGDYARIPLGHGLAMEQINGTMAYFEPVTTIDQPEIISYQVANGVLCAKADKNLYFTYDLALKRYQIFADSTAYNSNAKNLSLPTTSQFESFNRHYARYWGGWRFWLLA